MKKKGECEQAIRHLCHEWGRGLSAAELEHPSFSAFKSWLSTRGYSHYLSFRTRTSPHFDAEMWFDQEFKQTWRN